MMSGTLPNNGPKLSSGKNISYMASLDINKATIWKMLDVTVDSLLPHLYLFAHGSLYFLGFMFFVFTFLLVLMVYSLLENPWVEFGTDNVYMKTEGKES